MSTRSRLILAIVAAAVIVAGVVGLIIGTVVAVNPSPGAAPGTTGTVSPAPDSSSGPVGIHLTDQGWLEEPATTNFEAYGVQAALAVWYYDSRETTGTRTIDHLVEWVGATPEFLGTTPYKPLAERTLALFIPDDATFDEQRSLGMWVTSELVGEPKVDLDHTDYAENAGLVQAQIDAGLHTVTSTVEVTYHFMGSNGVEQTETDERVVSIAVYCPQSEECHVLEWKDEQIF